MLFQFFTSILPSWGIFLNSGNVNFIYLVIFLLGRFLSVGFLNIKSSIIFIVFISYDGNFSI